MIFQILFLMSAFWVLYTYIGHPLLLFFIARIHPQKWSQENIDLSTIVYISVFNEEKMIERKIRNLLGQDFKGDCRIIIANDGSTDRTAEIVRSFQDPKVVLYDFKDNRGKAAVQNEIIPKLNCEIVVFTDATSIWPRDTLKKIIQNFKDPNVGCVSVDIMFVNQTNGAVERGQGAYWKYERFLRKYGALVKTNIVASGTCYAIRKELFSAIPNDVGEDLATPLNVAMKGRRVIFVPEIMVEEKSSISHNSEFKMRTRISIRNVTGIFKYWRFLHPQYGFAAYQLLAHKYLRILCWLPLLLAFIFNLMQLNKPPYCYIFPLHFGFYFLAFWGYLIEKRGRRAKLTYIPYYFVLLNFACMIGFINYCRGVRKPTWNTDR